MCAFCAKFKEDDTKDIKSYLIRAQNVLVALDRACAMRTKLGKGWEISQLFPVDEAEAPSLSLLPTGEACEPDRYYHPKHFYQVMIVEGTRLLNIKSNGRSNSYGSLLRNEDTGEMCYACADGQFFNHKQIQRLRQKYFHEEIFTWHPVYFPITKEGKIDVSHFIRSRYQLTFPMQFWGHDSYDRQVEWLSKQEGLE